MPCVPLLDSSEQDAEMDASTAALPPFLTSVWYFHANASPAERVGTVAFQYRIPLDHDASSVSNPEFLPQFRPQSPSLDPQEA